MAQFHSSSTFFILFGFLLTVPFALHCLGEADGVYRLGNHVDSRTLAEIRRTDVQADVAINRSFKMKHYWELGLFGAKSETPMAWYIAALTFGFLNGMVNQRLFEANSKWNLAYSALSSLVTLPFNRMANGWLQRHSNGVFDHSPRVYVALNALGQIAGEVALKKMLKSNAPITPVWAFPALFAIQPFVDSSWFVPGMPR